MCTGSLLPFRADLIDLAAAGLQQKLLFQNEARRLFDFQQFLETTSSRNHQKIQEPCGFVGIQVPSQKVFGVGLEGPGAF